MWLAPLCSMRTYLVFVLSPLDDLNIFSFLAYLPDQICACFLINSSADKVSMHLQRYEKEPIKSIPAGVHAPWANSQMTVRNWQGAWKMPNTPQPLSSSFQLLSCCTFSRLRVMCLFYRNLVFKGSHTNKSFTVVQAPLLYLKCLVWINCTLWALCSVD